MSIIITDNFQVNTNQPIDDRMSVGTSSIFNMGETYSMTYKTKDDILYRYPGLRVWDFNDAVPYVWTGATWLNENTTGALIEGAGNGSTGYTNYVVKFKNDSTLLTKSLLFDNNSNVGIGISSGISPNSVQQWLSSSTGDVLTNSTLSTSLINRGLHVYGNIKTNNFFSGDGQYIINIHANNIRTGSLNLARIDVPTSPVLGQTYLLSNTNGNSVWVSSAIFSTANNLNIIEDNTSGSQFMTFAAGTGTQQLKVSNKVKFSPSNGALYLVDGNVNEPVYSFLNSTNSGMYFNNNHVTFSILGNDTVRFGTSGVTIKSSAPGVDLLDVNGNKCLSIYSVSDSNLIEIRNTALILGTNATQRLRIEANGYIGIGTVGSSALTIRANNTTSAGGVRLLGYTYQSDISYWADSEFAMQYNGVYKNLISSTGVSYFNGGNVGIGVSVPAYKLDVNGGINIGLNQYITSGGQKVLKYTSTSNISFLGSVGHSANTSPDWRVMDQSEGNTLLYVSLDGVQIGTTSGSSLFKLNVNGIINASAYYLNGSPITFALQKVVMLTTFAADRNYYVYTGLTFGNTMTSVIAMLVCKVANNGFSVGDCVTAPTPYPQDSGRTAAQGIGVQFNTNDYSVVYIMTNDEMHIMTSFNPQGGAVANNVKITPSQWSIKLIISYY